MNELFEKKNLPFYKFGDAIYLAKIETKYWIEYICKRFENTGKHISPRTCRRNLPPCRQPFVLCTATFLGYFGYVPLIQQPQNNFLMHWKTYSTKTIFYSKVKQKTFLPIK